MIYYKKQDKEVEGGIYIKNIGWFAHEEMGVISEAEKNRQGYLVTYQLQDYFNSEEIYEEETKTPASEECLIDGDKHIGFYCYGISYIFGEEKSNKTYIDKCTPSYKKDDKTVIGWVHFYFTLPRIQEDMQASRVISNGRFSRYNTIEELIIPEGVESIDTCAFLHCSKLKRVVIPCSVKKIEKDAFWSCKALDEVYILGATEIEPLAFEECDHLIVVFGPSAKMNASSFGIYERYGKIGGSAYWTSYGFDHYAMDEIYFIGTKEEYNAYLAENEQLAEYIKEKKVSFYSETPLQGAWRFVDGKAVAW